MMDDDKVWLGAMLLAVACLFGVMIYAGVRNEQRRDVAERYCMEITQTPEQMIKCLEMTQAR
jgi:hypothetical protein